MIYIFRKQTTLLNHRLRFNDETLLLVVQLCELSVSLILQSVHFRVLARSQYNCA